MEVSQFTVFFTASLKQMTMRKLGPFDVVEGNSLGSWYAKGKAKNVTNYYLCNCIPYLPVWAKTPIDHAVKAGGNITWRANRSTI